MDILKDQEKKWRKEEKKRIEKLEKERKKMEKKHAKEMKHTMPIGYLPDPGIGMSPGKYGVPHNQTIVVGGAPPPNQTVVYPPNPTPGFGFTNPNPHNVQTRTPVQTYQPGQPAGGYGGAPPPFQHGQPAPYYPPGSGGAGRGYGWTGS